MKDVTSYKAAAILETDKKVNLLYGLNGAGKSTISEFLYNRDEEQYKECTITGLTNEEILVYNQKFIANTFYEADSISGIFTLSKENKEAQMKIIQLNKELDVLKEKEQKHGLNIKKAKADIDALKEGIEKKLWEIKGDYYGGDRVLEYCFSGFSNNRSKLYEHLINVSISEEQLRDISEVKREVTALVDANSQPVYTIKHLEIKTDEIESNSIFKSIIVGNEDSILSDVIKKLGNSDWVRLGVQYIDVNSETCPFCQNDTITPILKDELLNLYNEQYKENIESIELMERSYSEYIEIVESYEKFKDNEFMESRLIMYSELLNTLISGMKANHVLIREKSRNASKTVNLTSTKVDVSALNGIIDEVNTDIENYNLKLSKKKESLELLKIEFWKIMRTNYGDSISSYRTGSSKLQTDYKKLQEKSIDIESQKQQKIDEIKSTQKNTINISEAIDNINIGLFDLGIDDFRISKSSEDIDDFFYKIIRTNQDSNIFKTLSEGEKMVISFLYFRELCKGKKRPDSMDSKKIIVIDDPISSLSHIFIFNIGQLIKNDFFRSSEYEQIFLLTHSLYFYYEMTETNHDKRKLNQNLFRIIKNSDGSKISKLKYEEIQNDYQAYWSIIRDREQPVALIANCMRNIIEYFFNFVEKRDLNNVFQKGVLKDQKYEAFNRYINRESHSLGQNIYDFKEFDYETFYEALGHVFILSGYEQHYKQMIKV